MKTHIENFPEYLEKGYSLAKKTHIKTNTKNIKNILFIGMGGSGMASNLVQTIVEQSSTGCPTTLIKKYEVPEWTNKHTLMIVCSYSGNTEETVTAMKHGLQKGAKMIAITSGGILKKFAESNQQQGIIIPTGIEPRAALPYSLAIQLSIVQQLGFINTPISDSIQRLKKHCQHQKEKIQIHAQKLAKSIANTIPIIYATPLFTGCALRFQQQLNENSRMLCRYQIIPEMNHNELLGRQEGNKHVKTIFLNDPDEKEINKTRYKLTKKIISERDTSCYDIIIQGDSLLKKMLTTIYTIDRISYYTALERRINPEGMEIIEWLKNELKKDTSQR